MTRDAFIRRIVTEQAKDPLNLFLSYAHKEALICRLIVCALKARGHHIWFDELNIKHGSDWRVQIMKGIESSNGVLSMISKDAVRPGGVCLDELSIAVGVRGGNIRTVLLEKDVTPPPTIAYRQYEDMTKWQEFKERFPQEEALLNNADFISWFRERINVLIKMLETRENREFEGQITTIRNMLPLVYMGTSKQSYLLQEFHIERTWLRERVDSWLDDSHSEKICVIYGEPGIGKSAFAAHYAHYNGRVAAAVFCEKGHEALNSPEAIIQTLAYLLACRIGDYREYLSNFLGEKKSISFLNTDELFEVLIAVPLRTLITGQRPVECILIDGIDETGNAERNVLSSVLEKYSKRLPSWLRVLVLSRNIASVQQWFGSAGHMDITREIRENRADLEEFVREQLMELDIDSDIREKAAEAIVNRSDGVFLYAKMALNALREGRIAPEEADAFPRGLNEIFLRWFHWYFPDLQVYDKKIRPVLNLILASQQAIPEEEILSVLGWRQRQIAEFKRLLQVHLKEDADLFDKSNLQFNHLFIREGLCSSDAGEYQIFADDGILDMAEYFDGILSEDEPEITEFEALYIPDIMEQAAGLQRSMRRVYKTAMKNEALMKRQEDLGEECFRWNRFPLALKYLHSALKIAENRFEDENSAETRKHLIICKARISQIEKRLGHDEESMKLNKEALMLARQNLEERGLPEDRRREADILIMIADGSSGKDGQIMYYLEARKLLEAAADVDGSGSGSESEAVTMTESEDGTVIDDEKEKALRSLAIAYNRIAEISLENGDYHTAEDTCKKDIKLSKQLAEKTGDPEARRDLAVSYYKLAQIYNAEGMRQQGKECYRSALFTMNHLVKERGQPDDLRGLSVLLNAREEFMDTKELEKSSAVFAAAGFRGLVEPMSSYELALALSRELVEKYGMKGDHTLEAKALTNIGNFLYSAGDSKVANEKWQAAYDIYKRLGEKRSDILKKMPEDFEDEDFRKYVRPKGVHGPGTPTRNLLPLVVLSILIVFVIGWFVFIR